MKNRRLMKTIIKFFLNGYVLMYIIATIALVFEFYLITPMLCKWWHQALAVFSVLFLEDVIAAVICTHFYLSWKRSPKVYDARIVGIVFTFFICYITLAVMVGIYAWSIALWMFIPTVAVALILLYIGAGINGVPAKAVKEFGEFMKI